MTSIYLNNPHYTVRGTVAVNATSSQQEKEDIVERQATSIAVPYVTLRNRTNSTVPSEYYGESRGQLHAGICTVSFSPIWGLDEIASKQAGNKQGQVQSKIFNKLIQTQAKYHANMYR